MSVKRKEHARQFGLNLIMIFAALLCLIPFALIVMSSFSDNSFIVRYGYTLWPRKWSFAAYAYLADRSNTILRAYGVSVAVTLLGTLANLTITTLLAYPLSRRDLPARSALCFFVFFTMLFNGGLVPTYIWYTNFIGVKNTLWGLIVPGLMMKAYYVILIRTFVTNNVPTALIESAQIDGATEFRLFLRIILPMCKPIIATVLLFVGIDYWNDWYNGMIYVTNSRLYSIQNFLTRLLNDIAYLQSSANLTGDAAAVLAKMPTVSVRLAIAIIGILPIVIVYPFIQKNFVKGIAIGSIKG